MSIEEKTNQNVRLLIGDLMIQNAQLAAQLAEAQEELGRLRGKGRRAGSRAAENGAGYPDTSAQYREPPA